MKSRSHVLLIAANSNSAYTIREKGFGEHGFTSVRGGFGMRDLATWSGTDAADPLERAYQQRFRPNQKQREIWTCPIPGGFRAAKGQESRVQTISKAAERSVAPLWISGTECGFGFRLRFEEPP